MDHLWNGIFIVGGGAIAIIISSDLNVFKIILAAIGAIIAILFFNAYFIKRIEINKALTKSKRI